MSTSASIKSSKASSKMSDDVSVQVPMLDEEGNPVTSPQANTSSSDPSGDSSEKGVKGNDVYLHIFD